MDGGDRIWSSVVSDNRHGQKVCFWTIHFRAVRLERSYLTNQPLDRAVFWTTCSKHIEAYFGRWRLGLEISNIQNSRRLLNGVSPIER
ncbi:hypothetical protein ACS0TY_026585 [Phlomoides rotata]